MVFHKNAISVSLDTTEQIKRMCTLIWILSFYFPLEYRKEQAFPVAEQRIRRYS